MNNNFNKTDATGRMRIVEYNMNKKQKLKVSVFDYVTFILLLFMFSFFLFDVLFFLFRGISDYMKGNDFGAAWHWSWAIFGLIPLIPFGILTIFKMVSILKYRKFAKQHKEILTKENREDYYVDLSAIVSDSDFIESNIDKVNKAENNEINSNEAQDDDTNSNEIKKYYETDDATGLRIVRRKNDLFQKSRFALVAEWVALICLAILFLLILVGIFMGVGTGIKFYNAGVLELGTIIVIFCIYAVPAMLLVGLPLFFLCRSKIKHHQRMKKLPEWCNEENRIWATVKIIDFIDYKYAKDVFWVVCDVLKEEENVLYRYFSYRVKEDLFGKINPGQEIAVYINPQTPNQYYVNFDEIQ